MGMNYIIQCCLNNFRRWFSSPKVYITYIFFVLIFCSQMTAMRRICIDTGVPVTPWLLPFLFTGNDFLALMLWLNVCFFMSNAPFENDQKVFLISRSGRRNWCLGQMLYIITSSLLLILSVWLIMLIYVFPHIRFELSWGKVLNTLAQTDLLENYRTLSIRYDVLLDNEPLSAFLWSLLLSWLICIFMGMLSFFLNILIHRYAGVCVCVILSFAPYFMETLQSYTLQSISFLIPTSWADLGSMKTFALGQYPSRTMAVTLLLILIVILGIASVRISYRKG